MNPALPDTLSPAVRAALAEAVAMLGDLYGSRLRHLVLFGSQARGESHPESDVDVLVVLGEELDYVVEVRRLVGVMMRLLDRFEVVVSFKPISLATYRNPRHPLMINIRREGAMLV
ncbi:nucleotidyltransferase family protein [Rhodocaloribacter sp.]